MENELYHEDKVARHLVNTVLANEPPLLFKVAWGEFSVTCNWRNPKGYKINQGPDRKLSEMQSAIELCKRCQYILKRFSNIVSGKAIDVESGKIATNKIHEHFHILSLGPHTTNPAMKGDFVFTSSPAIVFNLAPKFQWYRIERNDWRGRWERGSWVPGGMYWVRNGGRNFRALMGDKERRVGKKILKSFYDLWIENYQEVWQYNTTCDCGLDPFAIKGITELD